MLFYVSVPSLSPSFTTNGLALLRHPLSWPYSKQLTVMSLHSGKEASWLWVAILEI